MQEEQYEEQFLLLQKQRKESKNPHTTIVEYNKNIIERSITFTNNLDQLSELILRMRGSVELSKSHLSIQEYDYYQTWCFIADRIYSYKYYTNNGVDVSFIVEKYNRTANLLFNLEYYSEDKVKQELDDIRWNVNKKNDIYRKTK